MYDYIYYDSFPERFRELFKTQVKLRNMHFNKDRPIDDERNPEYITIPYDAKFIAYIPYGRRGTKIISGAMKKIALSTYCTKEGWTGFELYIYDDDGNRRCVYPYDNMYHCFHQALNEYIVSKGLIPVE
ncbi:hypothetical protein TVAG_478570 [Trichomonas vaginalis G3]|uniref:Uncharacterized protein n=1 Tax=Trichomonas vaginalis (strain ATCC PRA-98 / G3) TaxID=412133 RepID=A2DZW2_TRIV3|nr:hypothetical protein TVAGG3_0536690 [Trichomonas vaginalis G3]XP_001326255.1 hypothetical protein TVAGG3_0536500 [Trichomonas vaginalis G3]EAX85517.1 hypothetical protein TVAG_189300 [Trichomonas vaginalis G3]EAY14021.1 hypothetical protein TVAG_478460 [Trichomonas vaginalis G3]EAY14032.1 hypothetical protein TVAG_478570 [Trichomonas vaginalis G3]KAI5519529.1 hypothetical protein TVAGG3_0536500 [Trichomonas vaginalis G3]KAI5519545.1 hypothetical protein TVAGG3_0536690 [Trichomonas vaginali|eukprot:XP_001298447.1 hypothetical protein [Trichomonas vaginalis G3]